MELSWPGSVFDGMKGRFLGSALAAGLLLGACAWAIPRTGADSRAFSPGGYIEVSLPVGDVHVVSTQNSRIELHYRVKPKTGWFGSESSALANLRLRFEVHGNQASVEFKDDNGGNKSSIEVELDIPSQENLSVRLGVGDIRVRQITGDLRLETGVGDIQAAVTGAGDYRSVEASTGVGDVEGGPFGNASGFVGKSLDFNGQGHYRLTAHTGVGDIKLTS